VVVLDKVGARDLVGLVGPFEAPERVTRVLERLIDVRAECGQMDHLAAF